MYEKIKVYQLYKLVRSKVLSSKKTKNLIKKEIKTQYSKRLLRKPEKKNVITQNKSNLILTKI